MSLDPKEVIASFDSASVMHASTVAALRRHMFGSLGQSQILGTGVRVLGRLPWPLVKIVYARIGGAEGIDPADLGQVNMQSVAALFADAYPTAKYPGVFIGSSNGALTELAAALQVPWLPGTLLVPVHRIGKADRPDQALEFGEQVGPALLDANPGIVLHQMHDSAQDELMVARMTYFRTKWRALPDAYLRFLETQLIPGAPIFLVNDESTWKVTRVNDRHVFQSGGRGGLDADDYLAMPHTPPANDVAPEAEWGADLEFTAAIRDWATANSHPIVEIRVDGPQEAAHPVVQILRDWTRDRGGAADRLLVPSFVLGDPWRTIDLGMVPFWTYFGVQSAVESLRFHLRNSNPYQEVNVLLFQHGADSPGVAYPSDFEAVVRENGAVPRMIALRVNKSPRDIGAMGRYNSVLSREPSANLRFRRLEVDEATHKLASVVGERGRTIVAAN
jgi:hypothetical protein